MRTKIIAMVAGAAGIGMALTAAPAYAGHLNTLLEADLNGRQEVSTVKKGVAGDKNGRGEFYVFGIDGDPTTLCYVLQVSKIAELDMAPGNGRAAHIHAGAKGTNGPVEVNLAWPQDGESADCLTEGEEGKGLAPGEVQEILTNPHDYYVNVHNTEFPDGAIRGQLEGDHSH